MLQVVVSDHVVDSLKRLVSTVVRLFFPIYFYEDGSTDAITTGVGSTGNRAKLRSVGDTANANQSLATYLAYQSAESSRISSLSWVSGFVPRSLARMGRFVLLGGI